MYNNQKVLAIIPARGGSKGLPGKNIKKIAGKPLISWTIRQAKLSELIDEIFVTTDSYEIAQVAVENGIDVPFLRPDELAQDSSSSMDVVRHVLDYFESNNKMFKYVALLEPTSPLRKKNDIDNAIKLAFDNKNRDGIISVGEVHLEHPLIVKKINNFGQLVPYINNANKIYQRQQTDKAFFPYGVIYLIKSEIFKKEHSFYTNNIIPYYIERWQNYEIDDIIDFEIIELLINKYLK